MKSDVRHPGSFAVVRCHLEAGEQIRVEAGAMLATSHGVALAAKVEGGLMRGLARKMLTDENLYTTTYTAPEFGGWVDLAHSLPGDVAVVPVRPEAALMIAKGSWIASNGEVEIQTKWGGMKNLIGGEGAFLVRAQGQGQLVLGCYGAIDSYALDPGETIVIDNGHVVAYEETVGHTLRRAVEGKTMQSRKSGEGLVYEFTGPGRVLTQSRNPEALIDYLTDVLPFEKD